MSAIPSHLRNVGQQSAFSDARLTLPAVLLQGESPRIRRPLGLRAENKLGNPDGRYQEHTIRISVALSILVAVFASYTALDLGGRVGGGPRYSHVACGWRRQLSQWGGGIGSMHFVAMLAFIMPTPMSYDIGLTTLSLVVANVRIPAAGFMSLVAHSGSLLRLVLSGIFMGLGIAAMHYTGMAAMREHVDLSYDRILVALSLIIAIGASTAALWLAFRTTDSWAKAHCRRRHGPGHFRYALHAMGGTTFAAHGPVPEVHGYARSRSKPIWPWSLLGLRLSF